MYLSNKLIFKLKFTVYFNSVLIHFHYQYKEKLIEQRVAVNIIINNNTPKIKK